MFGTAHETSLYFLTVEFYAFKNLLYNNHIINMFQMSVFIRHCNATQF